MSAWNPWHGCHKISPGCMNCYVYRRDSKYEIDSSTVRKTADFDLPVRLKRIKPTNCRPTGITFIPALPPIFFSKKRTHGVPIAGI